MIRVFHEQGSPEWHQWRQNSIGGSDAAEIMGVSIYEDGGISLLDCKVSGAIREANYQMKMGTKLEGPIRGMVERRTGLAFAPACGHLEDPDWLRASLDGITLDGWTILECKYLKAPYHEIALAGTVPAHHWPQVQHCLLVSGGRECIYASFNNARSFKPDRSLAMIRVVPDAEYLAKLMEAEEAFWAKVVTAKAELAELQRAIGRSAG